MAKLERTAWERDISRGESPAANDLLLAYISFGAQRTCELVSEQTGRRLQLVKSLCTRFHWVRRARAYDRHLRKIKEQAIENQTKEEALIFAEREIEYREHCFQLSERLRRKVEEMIEFQLYETSVKEYQQIITPNGETIEVEKIIIHKPVKWAAKDVIAMAEVQDKLHRMAFGIATSRIKVDVGPEMTLEERINQARAAMKFYIENKLERAVQRMWEKDTSQDPNDIRQEILESLPGWLAENHRIPDPLMLTEGEVVTPPLSLEDEEPQELGSVN